MECLGEGAPVALGFVYFVNGTMSETMGCLPSIAFSILIPTGAAFYDDQWAVVCSKRQENSVLL